MAKSGIINRNQDIVLQKRLKAIWIDKTRAMALLEVSTHRRDDVDGCRRQQPALGKVWPQP